MQANIERYTRRFEQCTAKAERAPHIELRQLWETIASSYAFLLKRERRLEDEQAARQN